MYDHLVGTGVTANMSDADMSDEPSDAVQVAPIPFELAGDSLTISRRRTVSTI